MYSVWLGYTTKAIIGVDDKVKSKMQKKRLAMGIINHFGNESCDIRAIINNNRPNQIFENDSQAPNTGRLANENNFLLTVPDSHRELISDKEQINSENVFIEMKKLGGLNK